MTREEIEKEAFRCKEELVLRIKADDFCDRRFLKIVTTFGVEIWNAGIEAAAKEMHMAGNMDAEAWLLLKLKIAKEGEGRRRVKQ